MGFDRMSGLVLIGAQEMVDKVRQHSGVLVVVWLI